MFGQALFITSSIILILNFFSILNAQHSSLCNSLNDIEHDKNNSEIKSQRVRALCDVIYPSRAKSDNDELNSIPDFDLTKIASGEVIQKNLFISLNFFRRRCK